jgi:hypothetical protein
LASGSSKPVRVIHGQSTKLTRTGHGLAYSAARDELFSSEAQAAAIVVFKGDADEETPPLRTIQGAKTRMHQPWGTAVDDPHQELMVADYGTGNILIYPITADGEAEPSRVIGGMKARMRGLSGIATDPPRDLVLAASFSSRPVSGGGDANPFSTKFESLPYGGIFMFKRTDNGNVAPLRAILGPKTGLIGSAQVAAFGGRIYVPAGNIDYRPVYDVTNTYPRKGCTGPPYGPLAYGGDHPFIGVWDITDNGDVPPRAVIYGPATSFATLTGIAINPVAGEIYVTDAVHNGTFAFMVPDFFHP